MNDRLEYVEGCLLAWAEWNRDGRVRIGYPSRTTIARLMKEGAGAGHQAVVPAVDMPEQVANVERAIRALPEQERAVLKAKYLRMADNDRTRARWLKMSEARFYRALERAKWFLRGRIG